MQISKINFNVPTSNLKPQKPFSKSIPSKVVFLGQDKDIFSVTNDFSNEMAINLLRTKLAKCMTQEEIEDCMQSFEKICKELGIEPKNLPIDEEHPGNLTDKQRKQFFLTVKDYIFSA